MLLLNVFRSNIEQMCIIVYDQSVTTMVLLQWNNQPAKLCYPYLHRIALFCIRRSCEFVVNNFFMTSGRVTSPPTHSPTPPPPPHEWNKRKFLYPIHKHLYINFIYIYIHTFLLLYAVIKY